MSDAPPPSPSDLPPPWSTGTQRPIDLTGTTFPFKDDQPVLLSMPGTTAWYLPCFTKVEDLRALMVRLSITGYTIKQIQDGSEFFDSIPTTDPDGRLLHVILNPWVTEKGTVRFMQVGDRD